MKVVILAGGRGVRLRPLTYTIPKPLLPIGEKPLLEEIIDRLRARGFDDLVLAVGYRAELIETYFRDGSQLSVHIDYVRESAPLGTAGPLAMVRERFHPDAPLFVMNGDVLTDLDPRTLLAAHERGGYEMTVATREFALQHPYGVIHTDGGRVVEIIEKPTETDTVSAGLYVLAPRALARVPSDAPLDMPDLANRIIADGGEVGSFLFEGEWMAIDRIEHLEDAGRLLAERHA